MEVISLKFESRLRICETVVSSLPLEPWVSGVLPCLHPPEEGFEGKVHAHLNVLENLRMNLVQIGSFLLPLCQDLVGFIER